MALTTKATLVAEATEWLDSPSWLSARSDNLLVLAEARLNRLLDGRSGQAETTLTGVVDDRTLTLPADFIEAVELWLERDGERYELVPRTVSSLAYMGTSGEPEAFAINADLIDLNRPCDQAYSFRLHYSQKLALTSDGDSNWLLEQAPDAYFQALMTEAYAFRGEDSKAAMWDGRLSQTIDALNWRDARSDALATLTVDAALLSRRVFDINTGE